MINLETLKEKKKALEERRASLKAEEKYLESEKARLKAKLAELGYNSLKEAKAALAQMEQDLEEKSIELENLLDVLENSTAETKQVQAASAVTSNVGITSIDDL